MLCLGNYSSVGSQFILLFLTELRFAATCNCQ